MTPESIEIGRLNLEIARLRAAIRDFENADHAWNSLISPSPETKDWWLKARKRLAEIAREEP